MPFHLLMGMCTPFLLLRHPPPPPDPRRLELEDAVVPLEGVRAAGTDLEYS